MTRKEILNNDSGSESRDHETIIDVPESPVRGTETRPLLTKATLYNCHRFRGAPEVARVPGVEATLWEFRKGK